MLSAALASQSTVAAGLTDFVTSKCWELSLPYASCPFAESQSRELLVASGTGSLFFDQPLLEKIFSQLKEDLLSSPQSSCVRRLSFAPLAGVERQVRGSLGNGVLAIGILHPLPLDFRFIRGTHPLSFVQPHVHTGLNLGRGGSLVVRERSDRAGSSSFSRLLQPAVCGDEGLRVVEASHRPLATESEGSKASFKMETLQSVLLSVRREDWMVSIDLKDAYLQVLMHPDSRKSLRFVAFGKMYQFKILCFGLSTALQVFTRVMAPVLAFLHRSGIRLRRYLSDWLIQASSRGQVLLALDTALHLCHLLRIVVNWEKSQLVPTQRMVYLGVLLDSVSFRASPAQKRVEKLLSISYVLFCEEQPVSSWLELLGVLSSMIQLVPGGRLRMRSLQLVLRRAWVHCNQSALVSWTPEIRLDLEWWLTRSRLEEGTSLAQVSPQLDLWSDASDVGWGVHLGQEVASGLWSLEEAELSINARELLAVEYGL